MERIVVEYDEVGKRRVIELAKAYHYRSVSQFVRDVLAKWDRERPPLTYEPRTPTA